MTKKSPKHQSILLVLLWRPPPPPPPAATVRTKNRQNTASIWWFFNFRAKNYSDNNKTNAISTKTYTKIFWTTDKAIKSDDVWTKAEFLKRKTKNWNLIWIVNAKSHELGWSVNNIKVKGKNTYWRSFCRPLQFRAKATDRPENRQNAKMKWAQNGMSWIWRVP